LRSRGRKKGKKGWQDHTTTKKLPNAKVNTQRGDIAARTGTGGNGQFFRGGELRLFGGGGGYTPISRKIGSAGPSRRGEKRLEPKGSSEGGHSAKKAGIASQIKHRHVRDVADNKVHS